MAANDCLNSNGIGGYDALEMILRTELLIKGKKR